MYLNVHHSIVYTSSQHAGEKGGVAGLLLGRTERAARAAELQLCAQARQRRAPAERLLWPGRASPIRQFYFQFFKESPHCSL